jgi:hypothetical protein
MDLYQPLYVPRPVVEPELFASLRPVAYGGNLNSRGELLARPTEGEVPPAAPAPTAPPQKAERPKFKGLEDAAEEEREALKKTVRDAARYQREGKERLDLSRSVSSMASAAKLGDSFQYVIDHPVTLPRQKSALLPIVNKEVEGTRVSIYNEGTQAKFPLLGLKFKNTSGLHLMQGPITVFEGAAYAGDARILDLQPGEERLLSYAIDLGTEVNPVPNPSNGRLTHVKVVKGVLHSTTKLREAKTYTIANRNEAARVVLVEHPVRNDFTLVDTAKPAEKASDVYRFEVKVAPGQTEKLTVTEERVLNEQVAIGGFNDDQVRHFLSQTVASAKVKEGLKEAQRLRWELEKTQREVREQERQLKVITEDQVRLRANLKEMPPTAAAYKRYLDKFDAQETQIEKYQAAIQEMQQAEHEQRKRLDDFLAAFSAE